MKLFTLLLLFFSWISYASPAHAQEGKTIRGQVTGNDKKNVNGAVVSLLKAADSSLVKSNITEADGQFLFPGLESGKYFVVVSDSGYQSYTSEVIETAPEEKVLNIQLKSESAEKLQEVSITAKIPVIQRKIDRTIVNVDAMISSTGNSVYELLQKSPGVMINQSGEIMLKGKPGVLIYIDDKPTYLSGEALLNYLRALPATAVSQLELMTNPPAKYDAAGNVGIINIITKKSKLRGFNGNLTVSYGQGKYPKNNNSFNFNYRNNKINIFGTAGGGYNTNFSDLYINRTYRNEDGSVASYFRQNTQAKGESAYGTLKLGADYYATKKTTLGISLNSLLDNTLDKSRNISLLSNAADALTSSVIADNGENSEFKTGSVNLNLRHKFDSTGKMLTADLDYVYYGTLSDQSFLNNTYAPDGVLTLTDQLGGHLPAKINIYAFKTDYTHPLKDDSKFEAGIKTSYTDIDNLANYYATVSGITTPDYDKSNHFKYKEMINAAYLNFNKNYKRFAFQAGLRSEGTISIGNQLGNPVKPSAQFKRDYLSVFPTAYLTYDLDSAKNNQLALSYGRRIDRPFYQDLNPFIRPLDKFTFYSGNPTLRPMFSQNLSFTYSFKQYLSAALSYSVTKNQINETIEIDASKLYFSRPGNIGKSESSTVSVNGTIQFAKWLSTNYYSEVTHTHYVSQLYTQKLDARGTYFYFNLNNSFQFGKGWSGEISCYYITNMTSAQFTLRHRGQLNVGVQKKVLKDKGTVRLMVRDLLYTELNRGIINNLQLTDASYSNRYDSRAVFLSFTYSFGKPFVTEPKHRSSGSESEQQRVKQ